MVSSKLPVPPMRSRITAAARSLFDAWAGKTFTPVRLIGVGVGQLSAGNEQLSLFADPNEDQQRTVHVGEIADRFEKPLGR